jgi:hypothetical protein
MALRHPVAEDPILRCERYIFHICKEADSKSAAFLSSPRTPSVHVFEAARPDEVSTPSPGAHRDR